MTNPVDVCRLDYLTGTIATAYKGMVTSLVVKDFCMREEDGTMTLKGTVLSMPEGNYTAALMHEGKELARTGLHQGFFSLASESGVVRKARNLQIDIVQNGRHIGTFLLKREKSGEAFVSAMEISEELEGIDLRLLTSGLQERPGLLDKAENIVAMVLSTKKDWKKFSEKINSFASDVFWYARKNFFINYRTLVRYSLKACENADAGSEGKTTMNLLFLIELPLEKEEDPGRLRSMTETWLDEISGSTVDLSLRYAAARRAVKAIHERFRDVGLSAVRDRLLAPLKKRVEAAPLLGEAVTDALKEVIREEDLSDLGPYRELSRQEILRNISQASSFLEEGKYAKAIDMLGQIDPGMTDDAAMIAAFFKTVTKNITTGTAERLVAALYAAFPVFPSLSADARKTAMRNLSEFIRKLIGLGLPETCEELLGRVGKGDLPAKEDILLDADLGLAVLDSAHEGLLVRYKAMLKQIVIPGSRISGFSPETWAEVANPLHLERLSRFMDIIRIDTRAFRDVLIHVISNLFISGVFIPDDKLFQRRISVYMNSDTFGSDFLLDYMLLARLPVFFNEVGATGRIRDYTTEIDAWGNDTVLYFLRKQVHVNASNYNIRLIEKIISAWVEDDPDILKGSLPDDVLSKVNKELLGKYASAVRPFFKSLGITSNSGLHLEKILETPEGVIREALEKIETSDEIRLKIFYLMMTYREIVRKYSFAAVDDREGVDEGQGRTQRPGSAIEGARRLKQTMVSPEKTMPRESLYFKRHIAFGIPSVLGSYTEPKFDALGDFLRTEEKIRVAFEDLSQEIGRSKDPSPENLRSWVSSLSLMKDFFDLHSLKNFQSDEIVAVLKHSRLRFSQVADLLRMWQRELTWIVDFFHRTFHGPLSDILVIFPRDEMTEHLRGLNLQGKDFVEKAADILMRDILDSVAGLVELDSIINVLLSALVRTISHGADPVFSVTGEPEPTQEVFRLDELDDESVMCLAPLVGSKAKNLMYLRNNGLRIPAGVVFTAARTADYEDYTGGDDFRLALKKSVEWIGEKTGGVFGDVENPLLLSVRSGSYISMPGILSSILYCGMNETTFQGLLAGNGDARHAWDSRRRFIEHYASVVFGVEEKIFQDLLSGFQGKKGRERRDELGAGDLEQLVRLYEKTLKERNLEIPGDLHEQLRMAVRGVYRSWYSEKAGQFRRAMNVSDHWGTAVTIMAMVPANKKGNGASVFFTRRPFTMEKKIYGETIEEATGDDLVYGSLTNRPLAKEQTGKRKSMEETDPELFFEHLEFAKRIEAAMGGLPQEVEAAYVREPGGERVIFVLQTRRMEFHRGFTNRFRDICRMESSVIGRGVGVHGGALSGSATFAAGPEEIAKIRAKTDLPIILLRRSASTADVSLMPEIDAIITSAGGATSHAAVLSQKFDLTAVVGCEDMEIREDESGEHFAVIGGHTVREGGFISLDGSTGLVFSGLCMFTERLPVS